MEREKNRRTSEQVTSDILIKRLSNIQLACLLEHPEFKEYHSEIIENLQVKNGFGLDDFARIHSSDKCNIEEVETEYDVRVGGLDIDFGRWSNLIPLKLRRCTEHKTSSTTFIESISGYIQEGSFYSYRGKKRRETAEVELKDANSSQQIE